MHLGNGIICPVTGIPMLAAAGVAAYFAYKKAKTDFSKDKIFKTVAATGLVFAMQMINFAIPETGSSGHIVGAILLAILLGPAAAFLAMCAILIVQAVFFADGGLLALGCNIINMGALACFVAYPLLYKPLAKINRPFLGALLSSIAALQFGSIAVVLEGALSGSIPVASLINFAGLMQAIHLPIGIIEGAVTGVIAVAAKFVDTKKLSTGFASIAVILAGFISQYASQKPDGLEWSLLNIHNSVIMQVQGQIYAAAEAFQAKTSILANMASVPANMIGLFVVGFVMYALCMFLNSKTVKE